MKTLNCFKNFKCIAKECKNNCCIGWEIGIDSETEKLYRSGNGEFFDRIRENITDKSPCRFIMGKEGRCPFLNSENLCDIIINLGEDKIPYICKNHPRFYEWIDERCEMGIGLACEEGARLLLSPHADTSLELGKIEGEGMSALLTHSREKIFEIIKNKTVSFKDRLIALLDFACELDDMIFSEDYEEIPDFRTHCHEQNTAILGIHKNENEASTFRAYETRFHIAKITPFPLKSIYLTCAPDKRNRIHSGHTGSFAFLFLF